MRHSLKFGLYKRRGTFHLVFSVQCVVVGISLGLVLSSAPAFGATYAIDFWSFIPDQISFKSAPVVQGQPLPNVNHPDYRTLAEAPRYTGTFSVADSALGTPNGFISLTSPDFLSFNATMGQQAFQIPGDPLRLCGYAFGCRPENERLGVRLDPNGQVQRFDIPSTHVSNGGAIVDNDNRFHGPQLVLNDLDPDGGHWGYFVKDDAGDWVILPPATGQQLGWIQRAGGQDDVITPLGGTYIDGLVNVWSTHNWDGPNPSGGFFRISAASGDPGPGPDASVIPEPSTVLLLGSGVIGLLAIRKRRA